MSYMKMCPRCGEFSLEVLTSFSHCAQCLYVEDDWLDSEKSYYEARRKMKEMTGECDEEDEIDEDSPLCA